jgi:hypothetical protein
MYAALTAEELVELEQLYEIDPWGPERVETLFGVLCSLTDACNRAKGKAERPMYYMPFVKALTKDERKPMSLAAAKSLFARAKAGFERAK